MAIEKNIDDVGEALDFEDVEEMGEDAPVEIEIILEEDGSEGFDISMEDEEAEPEFGDNLAEHVDQEYLDTLASDLIEEFDADENSRKDWMETYIEGLALLGMKIEERTEPWKGACGVHHPILSEAIVKFQAETMMETFPAAGPVKTKVIGEETPEKMDAAKRVQEDMNFEVCEKMHEYRPEHERMLWGLGMAGNAFKKVYFDPTINRQTSMYVTAEDLVVPYGASNLQTAERITHVMRKYPIEVEKLQEMGFYVYCELEEPSEQLTDVEQEIADKQGFTATTDDRYKILEMQVNLSLPEFDEEDAIPRPYIVSLEKSSSKILAIYRNWVENDETEQKRNHFVHYQYIPGFGFYAFGLIHLIGGFAKSGTSLIRQLVDSGTLSNLPGGFKTKGLRVKGDDTPIGPAEWRDVDVPSGSLQENLMPLPYKEPSQVLYALLQTIVDEGRRFASAADMKVSDMSSQSPVGTTLAILERSLKVMSAVQARIHFSMKQEFRLLKQIIRDHGTDTYSYDPTVGEEYDKKADYDSVDVIPVSDPNQATMAQKVVQYQAVLQLAQSAPDLYDMPLLHREMLNVLGIKNADKLVPQEGDMKPQEPVAENMNILNGKPVKAHLYQDHEAHISVHMSALKDPVIMKMVGQSPNANAIAGAMAAHVTEHIAYGYRKQIEDAAGVPYPAPDVEMDEETELQVSRLAAAAAGQVLGKNQAKEAAEAAQQAANDPIIQNQTKELEIKAGDSEARKTKIMLDAAAKKDEIESKERIEGAKIGLAMREGERKQQKEGIELGIDIARDAREQDERNQKPVPEVPKQP